MIDAAYRKCVELTLQHTNIQFEGCGVLFRKGACHSADPYRDSGVFFIIENISADHSNVITLSGGMKVKNISMAILDNLNSYATSCNILTTIIMKSPAILFCTISSKIITSPVKTI